MNGRRRFARPAAALLVALLTATAASGQDAPAPTTIDDWRSLEPAQEMIDYKAKLKEGLFDDASRTFLVNTALPQLALPKNRATIDRVRRRIREVLCGEAGGEGGEQKAAAMATQTVAGFMVAVARDGNADPVVRLNAALLVGELNGPGRKPWTPAVAELVAVAGDANLPAAVRIAAAAGLARHVDADAVARSADVGPALVKLVGEPLGGVDPVAADWLTSRAFAMLARMGAAAPAGTAAAAARVLDDERRSIDVRIRAALAVGRTVKAPGDTDVAAAVAAIRAVAAAALAATQAEDDRRATVTRLSGRPDQPPQQAPPQFGAEMAVDATPGGSQRYRRDAWRLATLADALAAADGESGLARVAGATAPAVTALAAAMRSGAKSLDAQPGTDSLAEARAAIARAAEPPTAAPPDAAGPGRAAPDAAPAEPPADGIPFGDR
ncbi:MAG: hypothetical protein ACKOZU_06780 [Planctomycetaceae bacterium]